HRRAVRAVGRRVLHARYQTALDAARRGQTIRGLRIAGGDNAVGADDAAVFETHAASRAAFNNNFGNMRVETDRATTGGEAAGQRIRQGLQAADGLANTEPVQ